MTTRSQDTLRREASQGNWRRAGLTADQGRVHRDYFARGRVLIEVRYDGTGRIAEALKRTTSLSTGAPRVLEHLGPRDPDKANRIVGWLSPK